MAKTYAVYIVASRRNGTLYTGVTKYLPARIWQHKYEIVEEFSKRHRAHLLVWYEIHEDVTAAILREIQIKGWNRIGKLRLIEEANSGWNDLNERIAV